MRTLKIALVAALVSLTTAHPSAQLMKLAGISQLVLLQWTGATSGSQNILVNGTVNFTTAGTYALTVTRAANITVQAAGPGGTAAPGGIDADGGGGGGSGAVSNAISVRLEPGVTYAMRVGAIGASSTFFRIDASTMYVEATHGVTVGARTGGAGGTMATGAGTAGGAGGDGGSFNSVAPGGAAGACGANSVGAGGGGGTVGSAALGGGGTGGCAANGTADHGSPPGNGDPGGTGAAITVAGVAVACGGGGGHGGSTTSSSGAAGCQGAVQILFVSL